MKIFKLEIIQTIVDLKNSQSNNDSSLSDKNFLFDEPDNLDEFGDVIGVEDVEEGEELVFLDLKSFVYTTRIQIINMEEFVSIQSSSILNIPVSIISMKNEKQYVTLFSPDFLLEKLITGNILESIILKNEERDRCLTKLNNEIANFNIVKNNREDKKDKKDKGNKNNDDVN